MTDVTHQQLLDAIYMNSEATAGIAQTLATVVDGMVTKDDLQQELKKYATYADYSRQESRIDKLSAKVDSLTVIGEDLNTKADVALEILSDGMEIRDRVVSHEVRLSQLEAER